MLEFAQDLDLGGGSVLILLLTMFLNFEQHIAQATNLLFFIPAALVSIIVNSKRKNINYKNAMVITIFGIIGASTGAIISEKMNVGTLRKFFGVFLLIICISEICSYYKMYIKNKNKT